MSERPRVTELPKYEVVLSNDNNCSYNEVVSALRLIFNLTPEEAGSMAIRVHTGNSEVIEVIHREKMELRESQIKAWEDKGNDALPISFKKI